MSIVGSDLDQTQFWNGVGGERWVALQATIDRMMAPLTAALLAHAAPQPGEHVIDLGCGTGETTLLLARAVAPGGTVSGVDISAPMLALARRRIAEAGAGNADVVEADAARHPFPAAAADLLFSRFGSMFFEDPIAAFAQLRAAMRPGGRLAAIVWQGFKENPWFSLPFTAAIPLLPPQHRPPPDSPGPFGFADPERVERLLIQAGWHAPRFTAFAADLPLGADGSLEGAVDYVLQMGPTANAMANEDEATVARVRAAVADAMRPYHRDGETKLGAACWLIGATA